MLMLNPLLPFCSPLPLPLVLVVPLPLPVPVPVPVPLSSFLLLPLSTGTPNKELWIFFILLLSISQFISFNET